MDEKMLANVIAEAGLRMSPAELEHLLARIDAAAIPAGSDEWIDLIAPDAPPAVADQLRALRTQIRRDAEPWSRDRLARLRELLGTQNLAGFVLSTADEHLGEFVPDSARRLEWLTGFTGSTATFIVYKTFAALFVDGRYLLQAGQEVERGLIEVRHFRKPPPLEWLAQQVSAGDRIGYDPRLTSVRAADRLAAALSEKAAAAVAVEDNPIDELWTNRPPLPLSPVEPHPLEFAGVPADEKIARLASELAASKATAVVLNQLDSIAWLLNVRGHDIANTPVVQSFAILHGTEQAEFFVEKRKVTRKLDDHLGNRTTLRDVAELPAGLAELGARGATVALDPDRTNAWIRDRLVAAGATIKPLPDPTLLPRARKNSAEIRGIRSAHERDGVAVTLFLKWVADTALARRITELDAVAELLRLRSRDPRFRGTSFDTIAGAGPNGAIVHYRPRPQTNRVVEPGSLLLVDSGGQYLDGTTDITRTVAIGDSSAMMRRHFTLVLKAHIAVSLARFPKGATGGQIDVFARQHVWRGGVDYDHGTGHGVGAYLGVHEGPQRLAVGDTTALEPGMVVSNEPGLYFDGQYGIRTENLLHVRESDEVAGFLEFEVLTLVPIDRALIELELLDRREIEWLDAYHARVQRVIGAALSGDDAAWLARATRPIER